jgi:hypothetical protein
LLRYSLCRNRGQELAFLEGIRLTSGIAARPRAAEKEILPPPSVLCPAAQKEELNEIYPGDNQILRTISGFFSFYGISFFLFLLVTVKPNVFVTLFLDTTTGYNCCPGQYYIALCRALRGGVVNKM